ncbi:FAD-dependent monooxygenase [Roseibium sp.]|uniref:FAD-dependent monooxygenase n=1 Tax=Roseibium sp. TaxID=1936156 RepID=UPI003A9752B3
MTDPVLIAGAGIGGLSAALALARKGHQIIVCEHAKSLKEVGAGLQLSPNATRCLNELGVLAPIRARAFEPADVCIRSGSSGQNLAQVPLGSELASRYGTPYLVVHRADLQRALFEAALATGAIDVRFRHDFEDVSASKNGLSASFKNDDNGQVSIDACALIGADGVWSKVRTCVAGHSEAAFTGRTAYRATIPASDVDAELLRDTGLWLGSNAHLVHYPIRSGTEFNIVALVAEDWHEETWSAPADRNALLARFSNWAKPARDLMAKPDRWLKWALCGVPANAPWISGRIALLGDAAHAMLPFAAQGAAMAIEDALVLGSVLDPAPLDVPAALRHYQSQRQARVAKVQATAAKNGRIYHMSGPMAFARDTVLRMSSRQSLGARMNWIYGWRPPR